MEKKNNKTFVIMIIGVVCLILITLGLTYAYWRLTKEQTGVNVVNSDCFNIEFVGENDITLNKAYPLSDEELESFLTEATPYHFTITNQCSSLASATINLESLNSETEKQLDDEWIDAILYETDYHKKLNKSTKLTGNPNNDANKVIEDSIHAYSLKSFTLKANEVKEYNLLLYLDQETPLQEDTQNAGWKGKITLSAEYKVDQFANAGTLRTIASGDTKGMWNYKDNITKIVIETKKQEKTSGDGQVVHGPFDESSTSDSAIESYVVCETDDTNCIGYLQGDGGIKLNKTSSYLFSKFTNVTKIEGIENLDTSSVISMYQMFSQMSNLQELDLSRFDTGSVTNMSYMFYNCLQLQSLDLSNFDTSSAKTMSSMFRKMNNIQELDLSTFDTSGVTDMSSMFDGMSQIKKLDLKNFDTSSVIYMNSMFYEMIKLQTLILGDDFDTSSVTDMSYMFSGCSQLQEIDLSSFDTSSVENMSRMFYGCSQLPTLNLSHFNTGSVTNMNSMFSGMSSIQELDLSSFNTSSVIDMKLMFGGDENLTKITYGTNFIHNENAETHAMFGGTYNNYSYKVCPANKPDPSVLPSWEDVTFD